MTAASVPPRAVRALVFTTLFPNAHEPHHGVFVLERLRHVTQAHPVYACVVAPVPYFPKVRGFGRWSQLAAVPPHETINGFDVHHPRYLVTPKVGMSWYPVTLALACVGLVRRLVREQQIDVIDAHYLYPDAVAAILLGKLLRLPVVMTARGTDVTLIPRYGIPRRWLRHAVRKASGMIVVARALRDALVDLGATESDVQVLRNGVDLEKFVPLDRATMRSELGWPASDRVFLSVGHLIERKGHHLVIEAIASLRKAGRAVHLAIVGSGPMEGDLKSLVRARGVASAVTFVGNVPHADLKRYYSAATCLVLASSREGWPNVLLEALACGTPVVATAVFGSPEVISGSAVGVLAPERTVAALTVAMQRALDTPFDPALLRAHAEAHSWDATASGVYDLFCSVVARSQEAAR